MDAVVADADTSVDAVVADVDVSVVERERGGVSVSSSSERARLGFRGHSRCVTLRWVVLPHLHRFPEGFSRGARNGLQTFLRLTAGHGAGTGGD